MAAGVLLIIAGVWLLTQTLVGDLPTRISSYAGIGNQGGGPKPTGGTGTAEDPYTFDGRDFLPDWAPTPRTVIPDFVPLPDAFDF